VVPAACRLVSQIDAGHVDQLGCDTAIGGLLAAVRLPTGQDELIVADVGL
jgi:hypothetical protein